MVKRPEEYKWSIHLANAWGRITNLVPHDEYLKLGADSETRCYAYREIFNHQLSELHIHLIERASEYCCPIGDDRFVQQIQERYGIKLGQSARGRPKKVVEVGLK